MKSSRAMRVGHMVPESSIAADCNAVSKCAAGGALMQGQRLCYEWQYLHDLVD